MKEVEITCLTTSIRLPDLGLEMEKGQVCPLNAEVANASKDLAQARRAGGVSVREIQRARSVRKAGPRPTAKQVKTRPGPPPAPRPEGPTYTTSRPGTSATPDPLPVVGTVGVGDLREIVRTEVTGAVREALLQGIGPVSMSARHVPPEENKGLRGGMDPDPVIDETPAFIPEKIVPKGKVEIEVESDEKEATSIDAASEKLKKKPKKTKKPRKKKKED